MKLSAVVITKDEEENIKKCLKSLAFADEIIIIDDYSQDKTVQIAKKLGAKIFQKHLNGNFAAQRNFGLSKAKGRWVLFIDADEIVSRDLVFEIIRNITKVSNKFTGYYLKRNDFLWGKKLKYGEIGSTKFLRLALRKKGKWTRKVHETWDVNGKIGLLKNPIEHHPHPNLKEFINHINHFSTLHAQANLEEGKKASLAKIIFLPLAKFLKDYILKAGFLDGDKGFLVAAIMSFHSFLSWSKSWLIQKKVQRS